MTGELKPGEWGAEFVEKDDRVTSQEPPTVRDLEYDDKLISIYRTFREEFGNPCSVIYPSCAFDASPSGVFDRVKFVDREERPIAALKAGGLDAICCDIQEYVPEEEHDLLILLNPQTPFEWSTRHLKLQGYVIANDYNLTASEISDHPDNFKLVGAFQEVLDPQGGVSKQVFMRDLEGLFVPFNDREEFKRLDPIRYEDVLKSISPRDVSREDVEKDFMRYLLEDRFDFGRRNHLPFRRTALYYVFRKK